MISHAQEIVVSFIKPKYILIISALVMALLVGMAGIYNSLLPLILVAGLFLGLIFFRFPDFTVIFVAFLLYTNATVVLSKNQSITRSISIIFPLFLFIPFVSNLIWSGKKIKLPVLIGLQIVYFGIMVLGGVFSKDFSLALPDLITFIAEGIGLSFLIINTIHTPQVFTKVVWALLLSGALLGSLTLFQQVTKTTKNSYWGFAQMDYGAGNTPTNQKITPKPAGSVGEKNRYAQVLSVLIPIGLFQAWGASSQRSKIAALFATALIFAGASLTLSRGAQLGFIVLVIIMTFMRYIKIRELIFVLLGTILLLLAFPQILDRFSSLSGLFSSADQGGLKNADTSIQGRATEMQSAFLVFLDHPLIGVGTGMFQYEVVNYSKLVGLKNIKTTREAHSMYFGVAAENGVLGFTALMSIFLFTLFNLFVARKYWLSKNNLQMTSLCTGFFLAVVNYMTTAIFLHVSYARYLWILISLATVVGQFREGDLGGGEVEKDNKHNFSGV